MSRILALILILVANGSVHAQGKTEPLVARVKDSITRGVRYAVSQQKGDGSWEASEQLFAGGTTALTVLALLNCDGVVEDPQIEKARKDAIQRGLVNLRNFQSEKVYVRALQTMVFAEAGGEGDRERIRKNVEWLLEARVTKNGVFIGWGYDNRQGVIVPPTDASNSQYALLALWYAQQAGVKIDRSVWAGIRDYYLRTQDEKTGSWSYSFDYGAQQRQTSLTMSVAGLCGLLVSGMELNDGHDARTCGNYEENPAVAKALRWIIEHFKLNLNDRAYYHLYGLERAGRLSGLRFFGEHDWYREGCEVLTKKQNLNGSWQTQPTYDYWPLVNTDFALLFLSKGRTPVVISKLIHGKWPRLETDSDWNNDRNDLRNLTTHVSRSKLFGTKPVAWQTYDISQAIAARAPNLAPRPEDEAAIVADMLQSPILYITGHQSPLNRIQGVENELIKRYVENGGFILAEACCGSQAFDRGIKEWAAKLWPDNDLAYIESTHPVWTCHETVPPGQPYKLMGLQVGCRTVMLYSPEDLSCLWDADRPNDARSRVAFNLGLNIVTYATGRVPPLPRLTPVQIAEDKPADTSSSRGYFEVCQVKYRGDDWQPAPKAMENLMVHVGKEEGMDVRLKTRPLELHNDFERNSIISAKFLYLHGRKEMQKYGTEILAGLKFTLENGGLLFADACSGNATFDKSFRSFVEDLFKQKLQRVPADDIVFSAGLNRRALTKDNIKCRVEANGVMTPMAPYLEGIRVNGRWAVLYSKYDIGCALEKNTSPDSKGYDPASALRIATAAVLYNARP